MGRGSWLILGMGILAALVLAGCGGSEVSERTDRQTLIAALANTDPATRSDAAEALGKQGAVAAVEPLIGLLDDQYPSVRVSAATALGEIGKPTAVPALIATLGQSTTAAGESLGKVQGAAATALAAIGDARAVAPLMDYAISASAMKKIVPMLTEMGKPAVKPLIAILKHGNRRQQVAAARVLGQIGGEQAVKPLIAYSQVDSTNASAALAAIGAPAVGPLGQALRTGSDKVREMSAQTLGEIGDRRATAALRAALSDSDYSVWQAASRSLAHLYRTQVGKLLPMLKSNDTVGIYTGLIELGKKGTEDELISALNSFGYESMAEDYLNCGNPKLEAAARHWASAHGYTVFTTPGFRSETWGTAD